MLTKKRRESLNMSYALVAILNAGNMTAMAIDIIITYKITWLFKISMKMPLKYLHIRNPETKTKKSTVTLFSTDFHSLAIFWALALSLIIAQDILFRYFEVSFMSSLTLPGTMLKVKS